MFCPVMNTSQKKSNLKNTRTAYLFSKMNSTSNINSYLNILKFIERFCFQLGSKYNILLGVHKMEQNNNKFLHMIISSLMLVAGKIDISHMRKINPEIFIT